MYEFNQNPAHFNSKYTLKIYFLSLKKKIFVHMDVIKLVVYILEVYIYIFNL